MRTNKSFYWFCLLVFSIIGHSSIAQQQPITDSLKKDSLHKEAESALVLQQQQRILDSMIRIQLEKELEASQGNESKTRELEEKLAAIAVKDSLRKEAQLLKLNELRKTATGFAIAPFTDTLFYIYTKTGSFSAKDRAEAINQRIINLYNEPFYNADSLTTAETDNGFDILYRNEQVILSVTTLDALWLQQDGAQLAEAYLLKIKDAIKKEKEANSLKNWLIKLALVLLIIFGLWIIIYTINHLFRRITRFLNANAEKYFTGFSFRNIRIFSPGQHQKFVLKINQFVRIVVIILAVYLSLPLLFSIFPVTKDWTSILIRWILTPAKAAAVGFVHFLPDLFSILVIFFIFRYAVKGLKYLAGEVEKGNIHLNNFHPDWAQPTSNIIKVLLYAFMLVLIFPYLPGSGSDAFKGVSVFLGILFSLGSSSAISNMIAGLVITYMRPFKIGDRIKIGEITGDVIEKTMLVTRIRTIKNEEITVPNSTVLSSSTINYSSNTRPQDDGLIIHTTVTIGYDVPWKNMHQALIDAALRTDLILKKPLPFVLQTSLDDYYVSYQVNAYTKDANKQAMIYSQLHQHIQDCCNEAGIEIMSPHYRAVREGNDTTIPKNYQQPGKKNTGPGIASTEKDDNETNPL